MALHWLHGIELVLFSAAFLCGAVAAAALTRTQVGLWGGQPWGSAGRHKGLPRWLHRAWG